MTRSWAYNRFGVLMGTSWRASGPRWPSLREDVLPMITLFPSQGDFCATAFFQIGYAESEGWILWQEIHVLKYDEKDFIDDSTWTIENTYYTLPQCRMVE